MRFVVLAAVSFVAAMGCTPEATDAVGPRVDDHEARIAALEAQVRALAANLPPAPLGEPPEDAWVLVDGRGWASNGHVLIRRDGPRPDPAAVRQRWLAGMTAEEFARITPVPSPHVALTLLGVSDDAGTLVTRFRRESEGTEVYVDAAYASALIGPIVQGPDPLGPLYALGDDGTARAIVMPRKPPAATAVP